MRATRPVILIVDDEPASLTALLDALGRRFGADYRVASFLAPDAALQELTSLKEDDEQVALMIADQWMPGMTGLEFLRRAHEIHPNAQRALFVAWGDREAAPMILAGCAYGQLDNYLHKPFSPPELHLYPEVSEFLAEWTRAHGPHMELVRVVGEPSARVHDIRQFLERSGIPHAFYPSDTPLGQRLLEQAGQDGTRLPIVILLDGHALVQPTNADISDALGATDVAERQCDVAIVGAGPAGLAAAVYAASEGLKTIVIEAEAVGGQAGTSSLIRNYLGFPRGISGGELAQRAYQQAWLFGAKYVFARAVARLEARGTERLLVLADGSQIVARAVVIATGARYRTLGVSDIERLTGVGVFYITLGDMPFLRGKHVFVAGGGNSAGQAALHLSKSAAKVTLLVRGERLEAGMSDYLVQNIRQRPNIEVRLRTEVVGGGGEKTLERLELLDRASGMRSTVDAKALFVMIGADPHTDWLAGTVERDRHGFILTGRDLDGLSPSDSNGRPRTRLETSMSGVFAVGDVRAGSVKRVASAVGEGAVVVQHIHEYLAQRVAPEELPEATTPMTAL